VVFGLYIVRTDVYGFRPYIEIVEIDNVDFGLRKDTFKHQPTYPNALRTTEILARAARLQTRLHVPARLGGNRATLRKAIFPRTDNL